MVQKDSHKSRAKLVDELRTQVDSFDAQITNTVETGDPTFRLYASDIESSSHEVFDLTSGLEARNWQRVQDDHRDAQRLLRRAEWVLSIVSAVVILLSVWITFALPREIVKPLISLKNAVDDAASGNYQIEFELEGKGELVDLPTSVCNLISHITQVRQSGMIVGFVKSETRSLVAEDAGCEGVPGGCREVPKICGRSPGRF